MTRARTVLINSVMDINRNAIWKSPDQVPQGRIERMNKFWGDSTWKNAAYTENPQGNLFTSRDLVKLNNDAIVAEFRNRLKKVAGFPIVPEPLPMRNKNNVVVYYLFFASQKHVAQKIIDDIFAKYR
jgi:three-Cys-motif partner protein